MKKHFFIMGILVFISAFTFGLGEKEDGNTIVVATDSTWPPFEFVNADKEIVGFTVDLVQAIAKEAGFIVKFRNVAWDGIFVGLANNEYDVIASSVTITDERKKRVAFSDPYFDAGQVLAMRKDSVGSAKSLDDLVGKEIGAQLGTQGTFLVQANKNVTLKTYDEIGFAIDDLASGGIDGIVADSPLVSQYVLKNEKYANRFVIVGKPMTKEEYGIVVHKENSDLLIKINEGLAVVKKNGTYDMLVSKWIQ